MSRKETLPAEPPAHGRQPEVDQSSPKGYNPGKEAAKKKRRQERLEMLIAEKEEQIEAYQAQLVEPAVQADYEKIDGTGRTAPCRKRAAGRTDGGMG